MDKEDEKYLKQCIALGKIALKNGESPVGAIIVNNGQILSKGIESVRATKDVTNHAEILAIREVIDAGFDHLLNDSSLYTTHEPCIMCSYVIRHHRISRIIYGLPVDEIGGATSNFPVLKTEDVSSWASKPQLASGVCAKECSALHTLFINTKKL